MNNAIMRNIGAGATRYAYIEKLLTAAISRGDLPPNIVLTEGQLAGLFDTSRTPVRSALASLQEQGLLKRFDGRGYLVAGGDDDRPNRQKITRAMLGVPEDGQADMSSATSHRIESDVEEVLVHALPFGRFSVNEQTMADHYGVSRTVVRELLSRFQSRGIIHKHKRDNWVVGPLTARQIAHYYAIRARLEPLALVESAVLQDPMDIQRMWEHAEQCRHNFDSLSSPQINEIEVDLHVRLLSKSPNEQLLRMVRESQLALTVNRVFGSYIGTAPFDISLREHSIVFEYVMRGAYDMAARALEEHLILSAKRTRQRLMTLSVFPQPEFPNFLIKKDL